MKIHADLSQNVTVQTNELDWVDSPMKGVRRKMIERDGEELARATSLVSYEAQSFFSEHTHDLGEEFIVLEGTFSDETGDFPAGTYVRNPAGSKHSPHSKKGCVIFVKLRQFHPEDQSYVRINFMEAKWQSTEKFDYLNLHNFASENVLMIRTKADIQISKDHKLKGLELYIIDGYDAGKWLRFPDCSEINLSLKSNSLTFVKFGHLPQTSRESQNYNWTKLFL